MWVLAVSDADSGACSSITLYSQNLRVGHEVHCMWTCQAKCLYFQTRVANCLGMDYGNHMPKVLLGMLQLEMNGAGEDGQRRRRKTV